MLHSHVDLRAIIGALVLVATVLTSCGTTQTATLQATPPHISTSPSAGETNVTVQTLKVPKPGPTSQKGPWEVVSPVDGAEIFGDEVSITLHFRDQIQNLSVLMDGKPPGAVREIVGTNSVIALQYIFRSVPPGPHTISIDTLLLEVVTRE